MLMADIQIMAWKLLRPAMEVSKLTQDLSVQLGMSVWYKAESLIRNIFRRGKVKSPCRIWAEKLSNCSWIWSLN